MSVSYLNFQTYPIQIIGINDSYNSEMKAIESVVKSEIDYSGDADDLDAIVPYFVFFKFCQNRSTQVATSGETMQTAEFTFASVQSQVRAWNIGVNMLIALCAEKVQTANENYQSQISLL